MASANLSTYNVSVNDSTPTLLVAARIGRKRLFINPLNVNCFVGPTNSLSPSNGYLVYAPSSGTIMSEFGREIDYEGDLYAIFDSGLGSHPVYVAELY